MSGIDQKYYGIHAEFLNVFGPDFDRLKFPMNAHWIAEGCGGNGVLICGSEKTAVIDCGMAYCGKETAAKIREYTDHLDYIICSHSHYDHIGAIPYLREEFPEVKVLGSKKCSSVLKRPGARNMMLEMGLNARNLYDPGNQEEIKTEGLTVDHILHDGDRISLGKETITAYETKGHTDCSMSFLVEPVSLLFASESTGILEMDDYVHTPILKSFHDAFCSLEICRGLQAKHVCLPHFGLLPSDYNEKYFSLFEYACREKIQYVTDMIRENVPEEEMLKRFIEKYKMPSGEKLQPFKAYAENAKYIMKTLIQYVKNDE